MAKPVMVHYTIGFHHPQQGGVESRVRNVATALADRFDHVIMSKSADPNGNRFGDFASGCRPAGTTGAGGEQLDADASTAHRINLLSPAVVALYDGQMPMIEAVSGCRAPVKVAYLQSAAEVCQHAASLKEFDQLWTYSDRACDLFKELGLPQACKVDMAIDPAQYNSAGRARYDPASWLYVGRIDSGFKRADQLVRVFQKLKPGYPQLSLAIIGGGTPKRYEDQLRELIAQHPDGIEFAGWKHRESLAWWYRQRSVLVVPSALENFCQVALEGLACGCQLVTNCRQDCGLGEWSANFGVHGYTAGMFDPAPSSRWQEFGRGKDGGVPSQEALESTLSEVLQGRHQPVDWSKQIAVRYGMSRLRGRLKELLPGE